MIMPCSGHVVLLQVGANTGPTLASSKRWTKYLQAELVQGFWRSSDNDPFFIFLLIKNCKVLPNAQGPSRPPLPPAKFTVDMLR